MGDELNNCFLLYFSIREKAAPLLGQQSNSKLDGKPQDGTLLLMLSGIQEEPKFSVKKVEPQMALGITVISLLPDIN